MIEPHIGITDFIFAEEVQRMLRILRRMEGDKPVRKLGVGVMMSYKTLQGLPTIFANVFPPKDRVIDLFFDSSLVVNILHYADYKGIDFWQSIVQVANLCGPNVHAIQLDMIWLDVEIVKRFRESHPQIKIIIQINPKSLELINENPLKLIGELRQYGDAIDGVLLDMSMGRGKPMEIDVISPLIAHIYQFLDLRIVVAGGLGPNSLNLVEPFIQYYGHTRLSINAQGQLRPSGSCLDPIDWGMAGDYLTRASEMFRKYQRDV